MSTISRLYCVLWCLISWHAAFFRARPFFSLLTGTHSASEPALLRIKGKQLLILSLNKDFSLCLNTCFQSLLFGFTWIHREKHVKSVWIWAAQKLVVVKMSWSGDVNFSFQILMQGYNLQSGDNEVWKLIRALQKHLDSFFFLPFPHFNPNLFFFLIFPLTRPLSHSLCPPSRVPNCTLLPSCTEQHSYPEAVACFTIPLCSQHTEETRENNETLISKNICDYDRTTGDTVWVWDNERFGRKGDSDGLCFWYILMICSDRA